MSETPNEAPQTPEVVDQGATPDEQLGENGKKALQAERTRAEAAEKTTKALQAQLDEIKKSQMSDLEKAQADAKSAQEAASKAQSEALRWRIAAKHGISDDDAETFLTGTDEDTLTRQAERLSSLAKAPTTPKPDLSQGGKGKAPASTADQFAAAIESAFN